MNPLLPDVSKIVTLLEYQREIYDSLEVPVTLEVLEKFHITERDFRVALKYLLKMEPSLKKSFEHIDGDSPSGPDDEIEFFKIIMPVNYRKIFSKYRSVGKSSHADKLDIYVDDEKGIYRLHKDKQLTYSILRTSKRLALIKLLIIKRVLSQAQLAKQLGQDENVVTQAVKNINTQFTNNLELKDPLILSLKTGGYSINEERFNIL